MAKTQVELDAVTLKINIVATFKIDKFDNGSEIDEAIETAMDALRGSGTALIINRQLFGEPKEDF